MIGVLFLALGPVMLYPCTGPPPPLKYSDVGNISTSLAFEKESLIEQLTFSYGWLSVPMPVSSNNVSGELTFRNAGTNNRIVWIAKEDVQLISSRGVGTRRLSDGNS